jgi:hypothetical protein
MQRELAYVRSVLQPHFAAGSMQLAVASAALVAPPPGVLAALQGAGHDLQPGVLGLLMQDSSVLRPGACVWEEVRVCGVLTSVGIKRHTALTCAHSWLVLVKARMLGAVQAERSLLPLLLLLLLLLLPA